MMLWVGNIEFRAARRVRAWSAVTAAVDPSRVQDQVLKITRRTLRNVVLVIIFSCGERSGGDRRKKGVAP
jgi:hypothetical protein